MNDPTSIGSLLVQLGFCTEEQVTTTLQSMNGHTTIGEALIDASVISRDQLDWALVCQQQERGEIDHEGVARFAQQQTSELKKDAAAITIVASNLVAAIK